ncbi:MAG: M20/M25/M40 family metallo-hydrolase [Desulfobacterales bacterium]
MNNEMRAVLEEIDEQELIQLLKKLISIRGPTGDEKKIAQYISSYAKDSGYSSVEMSDQWDVVARIDGKNDGPRILFLTHTDHSKPADPKQDFQPEIVEGQEFGKSGRVITGKGSCAPKATLAAMLYAGKILAKKRAKLRGSVIIATVTKDLNANHDGPRAVDENGWIDADMAVVGEPSNNDPVIGARGISHIAITIKGVPSHWGRPAEGSNPIWTIERILRQIKTLVADLPSHSALGAATLVPIHIGCEASPPQTPSSCRIVLDRRTLPGEDTENIIQEIRDKLNHLKTEELKIDVDLASQMNPFEGNSEEFISKKVMEISQAIKGQPSQFGYLTFSSNGGYLTGKMGIPSVVLGPGNISDIAPIEHVEVNSVVAATQIYVATAFDVLNGGP